MICHLGTVVNGFNSKELFEIRLSGDFVGCAMGVEGLVLRDCLAVNDEEGLKGRKQEPFRWERVSLQQRGTVRKKGG